MVVFLLCRIVSSKRYFADSNLQNDIFSLIITNPIRTGATSPKVCLRRVGSMRNSVLEKPDRGVGHHTWRWVMPK